MKENGAVRARRKANTTLAWRLLPSEFPHERPQVQKQKAKKTGPASTLRCRGLLPLPAPVCTGRDNQRLLLTFAAPEFVEKLATALNIYNGVVAPARPRLLKVWASVVLTCTTSSRALTLVVVLGW